MTNLTRCKLFKSLLVMASVTCPDCDITTNLKDKCFECNKEQQDNESEIKLDQGNKADKSSTGGRTNKHKHKSLSTVD